MKNKETFSYTYSASEQEEIRKIRDKYAPKEAGKMEQLRKLYRSVTDKGTMVSLILGIAGTLIMGIGMCCCLVWTDMFAAGIVVGVIGIGAICAAYPLYSLVIKKEREKIAPEIMRLTDELMK